MLLDKLIEVVIEEFHPQLLQCCPELGFCRHPEPELLRHGGVVDRLGGVWSSKPHSAIDDLQEILEVFLLRLVLQDLAQVTDEEAAVHHVAVGDEARRGGAVGQHVAGPDGGKAGAGDMVGLTQLLGFLVLNPTGLIEEHFWFPVEVGADGRI